MATAEMTPLDITWFEIPATDFGRAVRFYETSSPARCNIWPTGRTWLSSLPAPGVSGAVATGEGHRPSGDGVVIYLNCDGRIDAVLDRWRRPAAASSSRRTTSQRRLGRPDSRLGRQPRRSARRA